MTPASNFRYSMRRTQHSFTWASLERRSTKIRRRSPRSSDDGASWSPQRVMSCRLGPRRRDSLGPKALRVGPVGGHDLALAYSHGRRGIGRHQPVDCDKVAALPNSLGKLAILLIAL